MFIDELEIIKTKYTYGTIDWVKDVPKILIAEGSDDEMQILINKMWKKAQEINGHLYDYKLPSFRTRAK